MTSCGKLFQSLLPATGKARSPMVTSRVGRTVSKADDDERRRRQLVSSTMTGQYSDTPLYVTNRTVTNKLSSIQMDWIGLSRV